MAQVPVLLGQGMESFLYPPRMEQGGNGSSACASKPRDIVECGKKEHIKGTRKGIARRLSTGAIKMSDKNSVPCVKRLGEQEKVVD